MAATVFHTYDNTLYEKVYQTAYQAAAELIETAGMKAGQILVVGCSTSEVGGEKIGTYSSPELAAKVFGGIYAAVQEKGIYLAAQCCEHLNRAIVIEQEAAEKYGYEQVNAVPQPPERCLSRQAGIMRCCSKPILPPYKNGAAKPQPAAPFWGTAENKLILSA